MRADQVDCALAACAEAIRIGKNEAAGYACRGGILGNKGEYQKALKDLDYAITLQPNNGDYYLTRARIQDRLDNIDRAMADATKALELISSEVGRSMALAFRAGLHKKESKLPEAIKDYDEAVKLAPDFAYHYANRGDVYVELKDYQKAIADYTEAIRLDPRNEFFFSDRAEAYRAIGQVELAEQDEAAVKNLKGGAAEPSASPSGSTSIVVNDPGAGGALKDKAISLPKPAYPQMGKVVRATGKVVVEVIANSEGVVTSARATSGHPLLRAGCVTAARQSKFQSSPGDTSGTITYEFAQQ
jgi:TonB family protein